MSSLSDWESDLTKLSDSESEDEPLKHVAKSTKKSTAKATTEYKVTNALRPPRTATYSVKSLYEQMQEYKTVDLDPPYQRDVVWLESKQVGLIDSVMRNYYVPPIIFAVTRSEDGTETRVCIDGKQRLTSIKRFMNGEIYHKDSVTSKKYWYKDGPGRRVLIPKTCKNNFDNKQIVCMEYDDLGDEQEREIFQRVQLGVALTPAERMQSISGAWPDLIREIQQTILGPEGFGTHLDWGHARGRDFQCLTTIVYLINKYPESKFPGVPQLDKWLQYTQDIPSKQRQSLLNTFKIFVHIAKGKGYGECFEEPRVSPIEFTMTGVLIYMHREKLTLPQLSVAIRAMRKDVRSKHEEIRANGKVTKTMWTYLSKGVKALKFTKDKNLPPAAEAIHLLEMGTGRASGIKSSKRKRAELSDTEEDGGSNRGPIKAPTTRCTAGKSEPVKPRKTVPKTVATSTSSTRVKPSQSLVSSSKKASGKQLSSAPDRQTATRSNPLPPHSKAASRDNQSQQTSTPHPMQQNPNTTQPQLAQLTIPRTAPNPAPASSVISSPAVRSPPRSSASNSDRLAPIRAARINAQRSHTISGPSQTNQAYNTSRPRASSAANSSCQSTTIEASIQPGPQVGASSSSHQSSLSPVQLNAAHENLKRIQAQHWSPQAPAAIPSIATNSGVTTTDPRLAARQSPTTGASTSADPSLAAVSSSVGSRADPSQSAAHDSYPPQPYSTPTLPPHSPAIASAAGTSSGHLTEEHSNPSRSPVDPDAPNSSILPPQSPVVPSGSWDNQIRASSLPHSSVPSNPQSGVTTSTNRSASNGNIQNASRSSLPSGPSNGQGQQGPPSGFVRPPPGTLPPRPPTEPRLHRQPSIPSTSYPQIRDRERSRSPPRRPRDRQDYLGDQYASHGSSRYHDRQYLRRRPDPRDRP